MHQNREKSFEFGSTILWFVLVHVALEIQTLPSVFKIMPERARNSNWPDLLQNL